MAVVAAFSRGPLDTKPHPLYKFEADIVLCFLLPMLNGRPAVTTTWLDPTRSGHTKDLQKRYKLPPFLARMH